jgi:hypothetical protein
MTHGSLIDLLRGGVPALAALVFGVAVFRIVCRRPALRRLSLALPVVALAGSVALFRVRAPAEARLSRTPARCQAERDDATSRAATFEDEGPGADRASQLLTRMRCLFGRVSDSAGRG